VFVFSQVEEDRVQKMCYDGKQTILRRPGERILAEGQTAKYFYVHTHIIVVR